MTGHPKTHSRTLRFLGLSLLAHAQAVLIAVALVAANPDGCAVGRSLPLEPFEVSVVPTPEKVLPAAAKAIQKEDKKDEEQDRQAKGQVVELPRPPEERRPERSRFLSEYDSQVRKETKAPPSRQRPGPLRPERPQPPVKASRAEQRRVVRAVMNLAMRQPRTAAPDMPRSLAPEAKDGDLAARKRQSKQAVRIRTPRATQDGTKEQAPSKGAQIPELSREELAKLFGGQVSDALPDDVAPGEHTLLNSKRWRFASFFNRVKRQVAQQWNPGQVYRLRDPSGNIYGVKDRLTILRVKLTPKGELKAVALEKASGVGFLDDEAVKAFRQAQPFPNPPRGLVNGKTGLISFRFGFLFELSRRANFKVFRYQ